MKITWPLFPRYVVLAFALAAAAGCSTLKHRGVQNEFEAAVRADNERFTMPFTEVADAYRAVAIQITPEYIAKLDPKLRPNAWTLRSVSLWRAGEFGGAISNSFEGVAEISRLKDQSPQVEHSRDAIILTMLPGLVEDSRLRQRFVSGGTNDVAAHYDEYVTKFKASIRALADARGKVAAPTPQEVLYYWDYQCWRVLANWLITISKLPIEKQREANLEADAFIKSALADTGLKDVTDLTKAMGAAEAALPSAHPYRQLIQLERDQ
jgi:hypothetical protein